MKLQLSIEFILLYSFELFSILFSMLMINSFILKNNYRIKLIELEDLNQQLAIEVLNGYNNFNISFNDYCNFSIKNGIGPYNFSFFIPVNGFFKCGNNHVYYMNGKWLIS